LLIIEINNKSDDFEKKDVANDILKKEKMLVYV